MALLWPITQQALLSAPRPAMVDDQGTHSFMKILAGGMFVAEKIEAVTARPNVGILLPSSVAFPMALLGCWLARKCAVPFNFLLSRQELEFVIRDSGVDTILTVGPMLDFLGGPQNLPPEVRLVHIDRMDVTGLPPFRWPPATAEEDPAVILYTSGTSARPKGVVLTHGNLHANVDASISHARITQATTMMGVLPQFHSFGLTVLTLIPLYAGCRVVTSARFVPRKFVDLIRTHHPTIVVAVPSMYNALLSVKEAAAQDMRSIEMAVSGGEALPTSVSEAFRERFEVQLLEGYGLTETSPVLTWCTPWARRPNAVGTALPGVDILIVDENNRPLPPGQDGEILAYGPNITPGYYHLPEENAKAFIELPVPSGEGIERRRYFRTGDIGRLDEQGLLYITGRKKEMLKVAGEIVVPREIEEVLSQHPTVRDAAVIGVADAMRGEIPVAFVELKDGQAFDEPALRAWCRDHLAGFKVPREIRRLDALPRNPTGKVLKRSLRLD